AEVEVLRPGPEGLLVEVAVELVHDRPAGPLERVPDRGCLDVAGADEAQVLEVAVVADCLDLRPLRALDLLDKRRPHEVVAAEDPVDLALRVPLQVRRHERGLGWSDAAARDLLATDQLRSAELLDAGRDPVEALHDLLSAVVVDGEDVTAAVRDDK